MKRRPLDPATARVPGWITTYVEADWLTDDQRVRDLAPEWGFARASRVVAQARWSRARRTWLSRRGITFSDLRRPQ